LLTLKRISQLQSEEYSHKDLLEDMGVLQERYGEKSVRAYTLALERIAHLKIAMHADIQKSQTECNGHEIEIITSSFSDEIREINWKEVLDQAIEFEKQFSISEYRHVFGHLIETYGFSVASFYSFSINKLSYSPDEIIALKKIPELIDELYENVPTKIRSK